MKHPRKRNALPALMALEPRALLSGSVLQGSWLGQDRNDLVGPSSVPGPSGVQDVHLSVQGLPADRVVTFASIRASGGGEWQYQGSWGPWAAAFVRSSGTAGELFFEPFQVETGRPFAVDFRYEDGATDSLWITGGSADPGLRMPAASLQVTWFGQEGLDHVGNEAAVGPDGVQDVRFALTNLARDVPVQSVRVSGPADAEWVAGLTREPIAPAYLHRDSSDNTRASLFINPDRELAGLPLTIQVVYANGTIDSTSLVGGHSDPALRVAPAPPLPIVRRDIQVAWLGQDGLNLTGSGDVHLVVTGLPAGRAAAGAVLSDAVGTTWVYQGSSPGALDNESYPSPLGFQVRAGGSGAVDLTFPPNRDEAGSELTLRVYLDDGSIAIAQVAGGAVDLGLRAAGPSSAGTVASPGADLQELVERYGTVRLTSGAYLMERPLVLPQAVKIIADPGATLLFRQKASDSPWTAAVKLHASHITLEGLAIRFDGPIRWDWTVDHGPAVIGTTDNKDGMADGLVVGLEFRGLDIEGPAPATGWEAAPRLFRLMTAESGVIEGNILKGGLSELLGGPWIITGNTYAGTVPGTEADAVFSIRDPHDVRIASNHVEPQGASGKTWRFLVLTGQGAFNSVQSNTVVGIGPRDDDTVPNPNAAEILLTESYRVSFEGAPLALSSDGLLLQIPTPQGEPARAGHVVSVLSGTHAGEWVRIAGALEPGTYLLESPLPRDITAISISRGFVELRIEGNTIDSRGSSIAGNLILVGAQFGTVISENHLSGGLDGIRLLASPTEQPVQWGWTHTPVLGAIVSGNLIEDALRPVTLAVEQGAAIRPGQGRLYLDAEISRLEVRSSDSFLSGNTRPPALILGDTGSLDAGELRVRWEKILAAPEGGEILVNVATVNGQEMVDARLALPGPVAAPRNMGLVRDTGPSPVDKVTADPRIRFDGSASANTYEYRVSTSSAYVDLGPQTTFLPAGLAEGDQIVEIRAIDALGRPGTSAWLRFQLDTVVPEASPPALVSGSDSGRSQSDGITNSTRPVFQVASDALDQITLMRNGVVVDQRTGPGTLTDSSLGGAGGGFSYTVTRTDRAGNLSASAAAVVTIDAQPPGTVTGLGVSSDRVATFQPASGADRYEYRIDSGSFIALGGLTSVSLAGIAAGDHVIGVRAIDLAGNVGLEVSAWFSIAPGLAGLGSRWLGQDGFDLVGPGSRTADGIQDVHIQLTGLRADMPVRSVVIVGLGGGRWATAGKEAGTWPAQLVRSLGSTTAEVFIQPYQRETGRPYQVGVTYEDGLSSEVWVMGGAVEPRLKSLGSVVPGNGTGGPATSYRQRWMRLIVRRAGRISLMRDQARVGLTKWRGITGQEG